MPKHFSTSTLGKAPAWVHLYCMMHAARGGVAQTGPNERVNMPVLPDFHIVWHCGSIQQKPCPGGVVWNLIKDLSVYVIGS
jgi:hypothetical protein